MRIILIILSILALVFIGGISYSLMSGDGEWKIPTRETTSELSASRDSITLDTWKNQIKTEEKLNRLTEMVEEIAKKNGTYREENIINTSSGKTETPVKPVVKPSGKFLSLVMPMVTPVLIENNGIYGLYIFDLGVHYSTYVDEAMRLRIIATEAPYDTLLANIKALSGKPYSVNEVKKFPFRTFFVNPEIEDGQTRLVIEMENQALALEIPKEKYEILKSLLLGRTETTTIPVVKQPIVKKPESPKIIPPKTVTETKTGSTQSGKTR